MEQIYKEAIIFAVSIIVVFVATVLSVRHYNKSKFGLPNAPEGSATVPFIAITMLIVGSVVGISIIKLTQ